MTAPVGASSRPPIAMIVHSYYDEDPRVRREADSLAKRGHLVDVFALRRPGDDRVAESGGIRVHRLDVQRHQGAGLLTYLREYAAFFVRAGWSISRAHLARHYGLVQVHTPPDVLVFATVPLRLAGVPVILDLHEAMPEFFRSRFPSASSPAVQRLLRLQEQASLRFASRALTVNDALRERFIGRGVNPAKISVVRNTVALETFTPAAYPVREFAEDGTVRLVYTGALTPIYELGVVLDAIADIRARRPALKVALDIYGRGDSDESIRARAETLGLSESVTLHGRIPLDEVPAAIARGDIGLAPTRRDQFTDMSLSTKVFEYVAMGKPVIASRLPMLEKTFPPGSVWSYEPGDPRSLCETIVELISDSVRRAAAVDAARSIVELMAWEHESAHYAAVVDGLLKHRQARSVSGGTAR